MAHGLNSVLKRGVTTVQGCKSEGKTGIGSRRIFPPHFKLQVLDSYRNDADCKGNQRATARKYGIHRRQIQKWLQVENTLRNSVSKAGCVGKNPLGNSVECNGEIPEARKCGIDVALSNGGRGGRQRDDVSSADTYPLQANSGVADARVPCISPAYSTDPSAGHPWPAPDGCCVSGPPPAPLDFTTHSRGGYGSPVVASPPRASPVDPAAPMDLSLKRPTSLSAPVPMSFSPLASPPLPRLDTSPPSLAQPHPDVWDLSAKSHGLKRKLDDERATLSSPKPVKLFKPYLDDIKPKVEAPAPIKLESLSPPCCTLISHPTCEAYYYNNNNNHVCDVKSEYSNTYTLHELQPKSSLNYYYHPYSPGLYGSPEYEGATYASSYEDHCLPSAVPLKQRQSYSLDFKLQAIDCYYGDSQCKGNQRAVASKYNIHRRQVQKWLKQAEELRQRNETMKQMHAVR